MILRSDTERERERGGNRCWTSGAGRLLYICFFVARCDRIAADEDDEDEDNDRIDVIA